MLPPTKQQGTSSAKICYIIRGQSVELYYRSQRKHYRLGYLLFHPGFTGRLSTIRVLGYQPDIRMEHLIQRTGTH